MSGSIPPLSHPTTVDVCLVFPQSLWRTCDTRQHVIPWSGKQHFHSTSSVPFESCSHSHKIIHCLSKSCFESDEWKHLSSSGKDNCFVGWHKWLWHGQWNLQNVWVICLYSCLLLKVNKSADINEYHCQVKVTEMLKCSFVLTLMPSWKRSSNISLKVPKNRRYINPAGSFS